MTFHRLSEYLQQLEQTTLRNKMVEILAELFKEADVNEIGKLCYLLQGRVVPIYEAIEFGIADKMMIRAVAVGLEVKTEEVVKVFKQEGDLGNAAAKLKVQSRSNRDKTTTKNLKINDVYEILYKVATSSGEGSQEVKVKLLSDLIKQVDSLSARYVVRITLDKLRLGFSDMTVLDSFSWMIKGSKELRPEIERAYNVRPDLGFISHRLKEKGIAGLGHIVPEVGTPILMAKAERMSTGVDIIDKIGECAIEPKYDGFRLQVHFRKSVKSKDTSVEGSVKLFSRNLEEVTFMYPDIVEGVKRQVKAKEAIFEGEAIAFNPQTKEYLPFQETVQRKRKYGIEEKAKEVPLKLIAFDLLYLDGEDLISKPYSERREKLEKVLN